MAPLPRPFDARAIWIKDKLHRGLRAEALAMIEKAVAEGTAGAETLELARYLATAKRGRQPFGATHLWVDIGADNDELRAAGIGYEERMAQLGARYMLDARQVETAVATYERVTDDVRVIDEENRER